MGAKMMEYYKYITSVQGLAGKFSLARETKIPSTKAALEPDTEENLNRFREAIKKLTGKLPPNG